MRCGYAGCLLPIHSATLTHTCLFSSHSRLTGLHLRFARLLLLMWHPQPFHSYLGLGDISINTVPWWPKGSWMTLWWNLGFMFGIILHVSFISSMSRKVDSVCLWRFIQGSSNLHDMSKCFWTVARHTRVCFLNIPFRIQSCLQWSPLSLWEGWIFICTALLALDNVVKQNSPTET